MLTREPYDEIFDGKEVRSQYRDAWAWYSGLTPAEHRARAREARRVLHGDAPVLPFPRILRPAELRRLSRGVAQRGQALQQFLHDHYFGKRDYLRARLVPERVVRALVERNGEERAGLVLRPENLQFAYAPDIIRDPAGRFRILEDNLGFVGGMGDLNELLGAARALGLPPNLLSSQPDPHIFYRRLARVYGAQARAYGRGRLVLLSYPACLRVTHEDLRLEHAIATAIPDLASFRLVSGRAPLVTVPANEGLPHVRTRAGERVGFVMLNIEAADVEASLPRFWTALKAGTVGTNLAPGLEFVNDKSFYPHVDSLIRFYLGEEPLLPGLETRRLDGRERAREAFLRNYEAHPGEWVIKTSCGRGGDEVWLGPKLTGRQVRSVADRLRADPSRYVAQRYVPISVMLGHPVDLRLHAMIGPGRSIVSPVPWGRAAHVNGDGRVNLSRGGSLTVVLRR